MGTFNNEKVPALRISHSTFSICRLCIFQVADKIHQNSLLAFYSHRFIFKISSFFSKITENKFENEWSKIGTWSRNQNKRSENNQESKNNQEIKIQATDIPERRCRLTKFADDFTPVVGGRLGEHEHASDVINALEVRFNSKNLTLNDGKTKEVLLSFKKGQQPRTIPGVERVTSRKTLGVIFDENLSFKEHITAICKASVSCLYLLLRLERLNYTAEELKLLYNSLVISRLVYCASVWGGTYSYLLDQIDRVQSKAQFFGIIDEIEPIREIIRKSDQALLRKITETGYLHQLYQIIPRRTDYTADML